MGYGKAYGTKMECLKWSLVLFNFVYFIAGGTIVGVGIWLRADIYQGLYFRALDVTVFYVAAYLMIIAGIIMVVMSLAGCLGSVRESKFILKVYFALLVISFILVFIAAFWAFIHGVEGSKLDNIIKKQLTKLVNQYTIDDWSRYLMDTIQEYMECCGIDDYNDYIYRNMEVPDSCRDMVTGLQQYWGCLEMGTDWVESKTAIAGTLTLIICLMQILGIVFTVCLIGEVKKDADN